jgi:hypothetical protein
MKWKKMGRIFPAAGSEQLTGHAFPPVPFFINEDVIRVYLGFCDEKTVGRIGYIDLAADNPLKILAVSQTPLLDIGGPGTFDDNGLLPTCVLRAGSEIFMYYTGYQLGVKVRYYQFAGLAVSRDGGNTFERYSRVPVLDRRENELHHRTSAFVMPDGNKFRIWYTAGSKWLNINGKELPVYNLRSLESADGINWPGEGTVCLDFKDRDEHAIAKPWVIKEKNIYKMFYSVRSALFNGYRIGYAESPDGISWIRKDDEAGIDISASGWDSEMIAYAAVIKYREKVYLFYSGNNFGKGGFGYAVLEDV